MGTRAAEYKVGNWVFVRFPEEETGKIRKMSRPWYGPFRVVARQDPNLRVSKVYFQEDPSMLVHQLRVCPSPDQLPAGFFWYGARRRSPGRIPNWLQRWLNQAAGHERPDTPCDSVESGERGDAELGDDGLSTISPDLRLDQTEQPALPGPDPLSELDRCLPMTEQPGLTEQDPSEPVVDAEVGSSRYNLRDRRQARSPARLMQNSICSSGRTSQRGE